MLLLIALQQAGQQAYIFKPPAKEVNFLSKNKQIFDTYNFKKALKRVGLIQEVIYSCFAAYGMRFLARKSTESDLFVVLFCVCLLKVWNIFFVFRR